jgi:hypothetical protein
MSVQQYCRYQPMHRHRKCLSLRAFGCVGVVQVLYDDDLISYISDTDYTDMQCSVVWPDPDPVLQEQLLRANVDKAAAEEQRLAAEAAAAEREAEFAAARESLETQLQELAEGIQGKEAIIAQLATSEADARAHSAQLLARMQQLEADIDGKQVRTPDMLFTVMLIETSLSHLSVVHVLMCFINLSSVHVHVHTAACKLLPHAWVAAPCYVQRH